MHYIVLDLEWNIPTRQVKQVPAAVVKAMPQEIIEIGAVKLESTLELTDRFFIDVKPRYYTELNEHVREITRREPESLLQGQPFPHAARAFQEWCEQPKSSPYIFCTWSNSDSNPWMSNLTLYGMHLDPSPVFLDVQRLYALAKGELSTQRSVAYALEDLQILAEHPFHCALNDAYYTGLLMQKVVRILQDQGKLPTGAEKLYSKLAAFAYDPTINYHQHYQLEDLDRPNQIFRRIKQHGWTCPACGEILAVEKSWKRKKSGLRLQNQAICSKHGLIQLSVCLYRPRKAGPADPWKVTADTHLQRPL